MSRGRTPPESLVEVAVPVPLRQTFSYRVRGAAPSPGTRVRVAFRGRTMVGWVLGPGNEVPGLVDVKAVLDAEPSVAGELLELARWIADYYVAPPGIVLRTMAPAAFSGRWKLPKPATRSVVRVEQEIGTLDEMQRVFGRAARQREAYERLQGAGGALPVAAMLEQGFSRAILAGLVRRRVAKVERETVLRDPFRDVPAAKGPALVPTRHQRKAVERLAGALGKGGAAFLLHGVTGSGKTLVYVELLKRVLARGEGGVALVPEIALTPQTVSRFRQAFGDAVAVLHSGLSDGERFDAWQELRAGRKRVAVGARSAVFAPVRRLGVVVVDEEHEPSYKQSDKAPRYNARDVAVVRAARAGAVCVLGSATPALESWANAASGKYRLISLPERVGGGVLPKVRIADLRKKPVAGGAEPWSGAAGAADAKAKQTHANSAQAGQVHAQAGQAHAQAGQVHAQAGQVHADSRDARAGARDAPAAASARVPPDDVLSPMLAQALDRCLARKEQAILLLNRRGYANVCRCRECGDVRQCVRCSVSLTYHRSRRVLACHHCGHSEPPPLRCDRCGGADLSYRGLGTEQVERVLRECLPSARVARMDMDTTRGKWSHHEILGRLRDGAVDVLLGTQMIAKGLDFPRVTLVGVVDADVGLHLPDFRASERTFHLLAQVAGRAGRGSLPGDVVIQTRVPDHYVVRAARAHDYRGFVERETKARADPAYPPFMRMARLLVHSPVQEDALRNADLLAAWLRKRAPNGAEVLGPAPAPIEKIRGRFRWHVLVRGTAAGVGRALHAAADDFEAEGSRVRVSIDRDPLNLM